LRGRPWPPGLAAADIAIIRVNPARARDFARAAGYLAKTDSIDARMLAAMGRALVAALAAIRKVPRFAAISKRAGSKKVAITAVARKPLVALNAMIANQQPFRA